MTISRRLFLAAAPAALIAADDLLELLAGLAEALSTANPSAFMRHFDRQMKGYATLEAHIVALTLQFDVSTSIEPISTSGDRAELDWYLHIKAKPPSQDLERRRRVVRIERRGRKIVALDPLDFFRATLPSAPRGSTGSPGGSGSRGA